MSTAKVVGGLMALELKGVAQDNTKILAKKDPVIGVEKYGAEKNNCEKATGHDKGFDKMKEDFQRAPNVLGGIFKYEAALTKKG